MKTPLLNILFILLLTLLISCNGTNNTDLNRTDLQNSFLSNERILSILNETRTTQYFSTDSVSTENMTAILEAGRNASSGRNMQSWFFTAILNQKIIKNLAEKMPMSPPPGFKDKPKETPSQLPPSSKAFPKARFANAPAAIVIAGEPNNSFNLGLACENMVIAATALGYGTKIVAGGVNQLNTSDNKSLLGIPEEMNIEVILIVGKHDTKNDMTVDGITGASNRKPLYQVSKIIQ